MELCTILIASTLTLAPVQKPVFRSVQYFDSVNRVSERVLDRTICKDIERVHPLTTMQGHERVIEMVKQTRVANRNAVEKHCQNRVRAESKNDGECRLTK